MTIGAGMPRYTSHKTVYALKIKSVARQLDGDAFITPAEDGYAPFMADVDYVAKHCPEAGGYYVVYADGYASFSPAAAFESGYTRDA